MQEKCLSAIAGSGASSEYAGAKGTHELI